MTSLPYDCLSKISTFLPVQDTVRFASVLGKKYITFPWSVACKIRELALQFFLESRSGTERALLRAIDKDKLKVAYALLIRNPEISATVGVKVIQTIQRKNSKTVQWYCETVLPSLPQHQLFIYTPCLRTEKAVTTFVVPLLNLPITNDWLGETLIQTSKNPRMKAAAKKMAVALLLEKQTISATDIGQAFLDMANLKFSSNNEEILLSFLLKRPDMSHYHRGVGIMLTARRGYRRVVAALAHSLGYDAHCQIAFVNAARFGHREIITDFLANRLRLQPTLRQLGQAATEAAEEGHIDVVRVLLESTENLPFEEINQALEAATRGEHFDIVQLLEAYPAIT
jgi:hypothetical protein